MVFFLSLKITLTPKQLKLLARQQKTTINCTCGLLRGQTLNEISFLNLTAIRENSICEKLLVVNYHLTLFKSPFLDHGFNGK
jgi:hypothetical protein